MGYEGEYVYTGAVSTSRIPANNFWRFRIPLSRVTPRYIEMDEAQVVVA